MQLPAFFTNTLSSSFRIIMLICLGIVGLAVIIFFVKSFRFISRHPATVFLIVLILLATIGYLFFWDKLSPVLSQMSILIPLMACIFFLFLLFLLLGVTKRRKDKRNTYDPSGGVFRSGSPKREPYRGYQEPSWHQEEEPFFYEEEDGDDPFEPYYDIFGQEPTENMRENRQQHSQRQQTNYGSPNDDRRENTRQSKQRKSRNISNPNSDTRSQLFAFFHLNEDATFEEAKAAHRTLMRQFHPDRYQENPLVQDVMAEQAKEINAKFEQLKRFY